MRLPAEYGGGGFDLPTYCLALEEFARSHRMFTLLLDATSGLNPIAIARYGSDAQKKKYVAGLANGTLSASFGLTEPEAGSDSQAMKTKAEKRDGGWVLNGRKHYISGAHKADVVMVMAVNDAAKRARGGITAFLVERGTPGFNVTRVDTTIGSEAIKLAELSIENCFVPDSAVLGEVGQGFKIAMESLTSGRLGVSCSCIGAADRLIEMSAAYAKERAPSASRSPSARRSSGCSPIPPSSLPWRAPTPTRRCAASKPAKTSAPRRACASSIAPRWSAGSPTARCRSTAAWGWCEGYPVERFYRDVRHYRVGEGSSEIQRMLIARDVFFFFFF